MTAATPSSLEADNHPSATSPSKGSPAIEEAPLLAGRRITTGRRMIIFAGVCACIFLSALDLTALGTLLPTLLRSLPPPPSNGLGEWIAAAYALAGTAVMPATGILAMRLGRKLVILVALLCFGAGCLIVALAQNVPVVVLGRTVQGLGFGGLESLAEIVTSDLVPLAERGKYQGILGAVWVVAAVLGTPLGGVMAHIWREFFYLNLGITGLAAIIVVTAMPGDWPRLLSFKRGSPAIATEVWPHGEKPSYDPLGNALVIASTTLFTIGLTFGGSSGHWSSASTLAPLVIGAVGLVAFPPIDLYFVGVPLLHRRVVTQRTVLATFVGAVLHGLIFASFAFIFPVYLQGALSKSAQASGLAFLPFALSAVGGAIVAGIEVEVRGGYRIEQWFGWICIILGSGILFVLKADSPPRVWIPAQIPLGIGLGIHFSAPQFSTLAPVPPFLAPPALALHLFFQALGQTIGITLATSILTAKLRRTLPADLADQASVSLSFAEAPGDGEVHDVIAQAVTSACRSVWTAMIVLGGLGLLSSFFLQHHELHKATDGTYELEKVDRAQEETLVARQEGEQEQGQEQKGRATTEKAPGELCELEELERESQDRRKLDTSSASTETLQIALTSKSRSQTNVSGVEPAKDPSACSNVSSSTVTLA